MTDTISERHKVCEPEYCSEFGGGNPFPCDTLVERARADKAEAALAEYRDMERRAATDEVHADDSYGDCVCCRIIDLGGPWNANDDDAVTTTVPFPCAVVRYDTAIQQRDTLAEAGYEAIEGELGHAPDHCDCEPCRGWRAALDAIKEKKSD